MKGDKILYIFLVIIILIFIYMLWKSSSYNQTTNIQPSPQLSPQPGPLPSPQPGPQPINTSNHQVMINNLFDSLSKGVVSLHQEAKSLQQQLAPYVGTQISQNVKNALDNVISLLNGKINELNAQLPSLENYLNPKQLSTLKHLSISFNEDLVSLNKIISPFVNHKIDYINVPGETIHSETQPVYSVMHPAYFATQPNDHLNCYQTNNGEYCLP